MEFSFLEDEEVHNWAMFSLVRRRVSDPTGVEFQRTFVATPGAVAVVPVTDDGRVVLVSQYRPAIGGHILELPAGMRDIEGEDPAVTAKRELREETGWEAGAMEFIGQCLSSPAVTDSRVLVYKGTGLVPGTRAPHGPEEEFMEIVIPTVEEAMDMVQDGRIIDAKTCYGLLMVFGSGRTTNRGS